MYYQPKTIVLPRGTQVELRAPDPAQDAAAMADYYQTVTRETDFLSRGPNESTLTEAQEASYLQKSNRDPRQMLILPFIQGQLAGSAHLNIGETVRTAHRATVGLALYRRFWGLGLGTALMRELEAVGRSKGLRFLELTVVEENYRAVALYERQGYRILCRVPEAAILPSGHAQTMLTMRKSLQK